RFLESKRVKLKVELSMTVAEMNKQISAMKKRVEATTPAKIKVQMETKGDKSLKTTLDNAGNAVKKFNKTYEQQARTLTASKRKIENAMKINPSAMKGNEQGLRNIDTQLADVEPMMRTKMTGGKDGIFSSNVFRTAEGHVKGFTATMKIADGTIE